MNEALCPLAGRWAFRFGPQAVAGDKFRLGELLDAGELLLERVTWQRFSQIWPSRTDELSTRMNRVPKLVASRSLKHVDAWSNSTLLDGDLVEQVATRRPEHDIVVAGSVGVVDDIA